jgi:hypothetical protein
MADENVTPIRPGLTPADGLTREEIELALDEQRDRLWEVMAIVGSVAAALQAHFGDWPADIPEFPRALRLAARMVDSVGGKLEMGSIEERVKQLAAEVQS